MVNGDAFYYCSDANKNVNIFRRVKSEFHKNLIYCILYIYMYITLLLRLVHSIWFTYPGEKFD